jgi:hypothetical protein
MLRQTRTVQPQRQRAWSVSKIHALVRTPHDHDGWRRLHNRKRLSMLGIRNWSSPRHINRRRDPQIRPILQQVQFRPKDTLPREDSVRQKHPRRSEQSKEKSV